MFAFFKASRRLALTTGLAVLPLTAALAQAPQIAVPQIQLPDLKAATRLIRTFMAPIG